MSSGMTREETRLVAAVERFQRLEEDRQRMQERGGAGKRPAADMEARAAAGARGVCAAGPRLPVGTSMGPCEEEAFIFGRFP